MHFQPHEVPVFWWSWGRGEGRGGKAPNLVPRSYRVIGLGRSEFETRRLPRYNRVTAPSIGVTETLEVSFSKFLPFCLRKPPW